MPVSAHAAPEPIAPTFAEVERLQDAQATYIANAYSIIRVGSSNAVKASDVWWRPSRGFVYRIAVDYDDFFQAMGRPDLAQQAASRRAAGVALNAGGFVVAIGGLIVTLWQLSEGSTIGTVAGLGLMIGGAVMRGSSGDFDKPSLREDRATDMADRYNQALRQHLGLPPDENTAPPPRPGTVATRTRFTLLPVLGPDGGGLAVAGLF